MYLKNTAGQFISFQGVDATTGGIKSGVTYTVRRCIDGTFAAGGTTASEDGSTGWYKYAMTQADTNGNNIQFNFTGTGAVPQTINIVTSSLNWYDTVRAGLTALPNAAANAAGGLPISIAGALDLDEMNVDIEAIQVSTAGLTFTVANQVDVNVVDWKGAAAAAMTGDAFARLGAPAGASVSADIAAVKVDTAAIKVQSDKLTFSVANQVDVNVLDWKGAVAPAMTGDAFARLGAPAGASVSADIAAIQATFPANFAALVISAAGRVKIQTGIAKNVALAKFEFMMTDSTNHNPQTGLAVTVERSIDGAAFAAGTLSAVTEVGNGIYYVDFGAGDLNGNVITLHASATLADSTLITIITDA